MIEAVVQAGAQEISYRRAGFGPAVLILNTEDSDGSRWLFEQLSTRFRIIAPLAAPGQDGPGPATYEALEPWLRGLIDGLGLERPALVGGLAQGATLVRFATLDPHRVNRLALVHYGEECDPEPALREAARAALHPVLMIRIPNLDESEARAEALDRLFDFLG